jgi:hypothetical protein
MSSISPCNVLTDVIYFQCYQSLFALKNFNCKYYFNDFHKLGKIFLFQYKHTCMMNVTFQTG